MPSPCFFVALYCSVGLVFLAEASVPENPDVLSDNVIDSSIVNGASTGKYDVPVVRSIELSTEPPWSGNYVVNNITREIDVLPEEAIKETLAIRDLFAKYFDFIPPHQLGFDGRGIARYLDNLGDQRTLEIAPLRPGTYSFEYRNKEKDLVKRVWKVHSVPSFFVQPGSFFEFELNFTRTQVSSSSKTSDLKSIGVRVDPKRGFPVIYGLANDIQNGTVLKLRTDSVDLGASTMKIRLLLAERREPGRSCNNKKKPCLESITVWMKNFNMTIQNQESFAECLATLFGKKKSDLYGVRFQDYGSDAKIFEAKLLDVYLCKYLEYSSEKIGGCFPGVIGFNLTCGPKMKAVKTPPAPIFAAPTGKFLEISGAMGADTIEASSTTARIATEVPTDPGPDYWVSPLELETVPQNPNVDSRESISTTAETVPGTFDTIGDSADQLPSHSILNVTSSNDSKSSTTATPDAGVNFTSTPGIPSESLSTPYIGSVEVSSTTAEAVPGSFNTIGDAADDVRSNTILIDSESSTTATSDAGLDFSSTSGSPPESSSTPFIGSIEVSLTTAEAFLEPLTTVGPDSVAVSTLGSVDRNITSTPNLVPPPPADSSTPSNSGSGDNPEAAGVNRARDVPAKAYESFVEHALSYAIVWAAVFMVLFILIACTSR